MPRKLKTTSISKRRRDFVRKYYWSTPRPLKKPSYSHNNDLPRRQNSSQSVKYAPSNESDDDSTSRTPSSDEELEKFWGHMTTSDEDENGSNSKDESFIRKQRLGVSLNVDMAVKKRKVNPDNLEDDNFGSLGKLLGRDESRDGTESRLGGIEKASSLLNSLDITPFDFFSSQKDSGSPLPKVQKLGKQPLLKIKIPKAPPQETNHSDSGSTVGISPCVDSLEHESLTAQEDARESPKSQAQPPQLVTHTRETSSALGSVTEDPAYSRLELNAYECALVFENAGRIPRSPSLQQDQTDDYELSAERLEKKNKEKHDQIRPSSQYCNSLQPSTRREKPSFLIPASEIINIVIESNTFAVYRNFIDYYSPVLSEACSEACSLTGNQMITPRILADVKTNVFGLLVQWLYTESLLNIQQGPSSQLHLLSLWLLAKRLRIPRLQNDAIDMLEERRRREEAIPMKAFRTVYESTEQGDKLRGYLVEVCARSLEEFEPEDLREFFPKEMLEWIIVAMSSPAHRNKLKDGEGMRVEMEKHHVSEEQ